MTIEELKKSCTEDGQIDKTLLANSLLREINRPEGCEKESVESDGFDEYIYQTAREIIKGVWDGKTTEDIQAEVDDIQKNYDGE